MQSTAITIDGKMEKKVGGFTFHTDRKAKYLPDDISSHIIAQAVCVSGPSATTSTSFVTISTPSKSNDLEDIRTEAAEEADDENSVDGSEDVRTRSPRDDRRNLAMAFSAVPLKQEIHQEAQDVSILSSQAIPHYPGTPSDMDSAPSTSQSTTRGLENKAGQNSSQSWGLNAIMEQEWVSNILSKPILAIGTAGLGLLCVGIMFRCASLHE